MHTSIKGLFALTAAMVFLLGASAADTITTVEVAMGETHTLTAAENVWTTVFKLADGATLALPAEIDKVSCQIDIVGADSVATLDATAPSSSPWLQCVGATKPVRIRTVGDTGKLVQSGSGKLVVKGKDALTIGFAKRTEGTINFPECGSDIAFVDADGNAYAEPAGVSFVNNVLIRRLPTSAPYAFNSDTIVALGGTDPLGLKDLESFEPDTDLFVWIGGESGLPNVKVVIAADHVLCGRGVTAGDTGWGRTGSTVPNALEINGTLQLEQTDGLTFSGEVAGTGLIKSWSTSSDTYFTGNVDFDGAVNLENNRKLQFSKAARVGTLRAFAAKQPLVIKSTLDVGRLEGPLVLTDASTGMLHVATLAAGASITIPGSVKLRVDATEGAAAKVAFATSTGNYSLAGPTTGSESVAFDITYQETGSIGLVLGGKIAVGAWPTDVVTGVELAADCELTEPLLPEKWREKVALWLDASVDSSFVYADDYSGFKGELSDPYRGTDPGAPLVFRWQDCREGYLGFTRTQRLGTGDKSTYRSYGKNLMLARSTNTTVNASGLPYVDAAGSMSHAQFCGLNGGETRSAVDAEYFVTVFGSQAGGGRAVVGNESGAFARNGYGSSAAKATQYNIATNAFETYVDGTAVNPTATTFNGGWQIISMKTDGKSVQGLGFGSTGSSATPSDRGYCNYAEVLVFSEALTERERKDVEKYLADKWDIEISHGGVEPLPQELTLSGTGTITLTADTTIHGTFGGNINVNGHALTIAADGNLREATPHGTGSITAATYRQMPKRTNCGDFTGTMDPPPPGLSIIFR